MRVYKIPLKDFPEEGFKGGEIPELLDRIIIEPTKDTGARYEAFVDLLLEAGLGTAEDDILGL